MKKIIQEKGEMIIGTWTLNCIPFDSSKFLGKLFVTSNSLYFDAQFDSSLSGLLKTLVTSAVVESGHSLLVAPSILEDWKVKGYMAVDKKTIKK